MWSGCIYTLTRCNIPEYVAFFCRTCLMPWKWGNKCIQCVWIHLTKTVPCHRHQNMSCYIGGTKNTLPHLFIVHVCPVVSALLSCHLYYRSAIQMVQVYRKVWLSWYCAQYMVDCMGFCCVWLSCYCAQYTVNWLHGLLLCVVELLLCTVYG